MEICCLECHKNYNPGLGNVKILGVYIETVCPFCGYTYEGKFLNFVAKQTNDGNMFSAGAKMQQMARYIELNSSEYYNKDKKRKKRVR